MMQSDSSSERPAGRAPTPQTGGDDSGLHDIRALAETTQRRSRRQPTVDPDEALLTTSSSSLRAIALPQPARTVALPVAPAAARAPAPARPARTAEGSAPVPREAAPSSRRTVLIAGAGMAGAAVVAAIVMTGGADAPVAPAPVAPAPVAVAPVVPAPPAPAVVPIPPTGPEPAATAPATAPATETASPTASLTTHQDSPAGGGARVSPAATQAASGKPTPRPAPGRPAGERAAPAPTPVADKPATAKAGSQTLDDLLEGASGGAQRSAGGAAAPAAPVKRELGRGDIKDAMTGVQGAARACYDRFGVAGTVGVKLVVAPSGSVSKVQATGTFAGTPTGDCVAAAVQRARFPAWEGAPMTIQYSFLLSE
jgi:hypothetical protein